MLAVATNRSVPVNASTTLSRGAAIAELVANGLKARAMLREQMRD
jgi:hypothetical protein